MRGNAVPMLASALLALAPMCSPARAAEESLDDEADAAEEPVEAAPDAAVGSDPEDTAAKRLEEVLVTATRREEPLRHVPMSVYVVDGDWLDRRGARLPSEWMYSVPGLNYSSEGNGTLAKPVIRGIATNGPGFGELRPLTALYFGDTPITYAVDSLITSNAWPELVDIDRIEILRGPQGNYFGASSMGGTIRIIPRAPDPSATAGYFGTTLRALEHGGFGYGFEGMANVPVADGRGALRLVGFDRDTDGWIDDTLRGKEDVNDDRSFGARAASTFKASDRVDLDLGVAYERKDFGGMFGVDDPTLVVADPDDADARPPLVQHHEVGDSIDDRWLLGTLGVRYHGDGFELEADAARYDRDDGRSADFTAFSPFIVDSLTPLVVRFAGDQTDDTAELRAYDTRDGRWGWLAGVFAQRSESHQVIDFLAPELVLSDPGRDVGGGSVLNVNGKLTLRQLAAYGDASYRPIEKLELSIGGRQYWIEQDARSEVNGQFPFALSSTQSGFTPRVSARYDLDPRVTLYANAAKGFRPGGGNADAYRPLPPDCTDKLSAYGFDQVPREFDSDSLWSYEVGAKTSWFDRKLGLNAAVYRIDWSDIQTLIGFPCGVGNLNFQTNFGRARSSGAELDLVASPYERLDLELTAAYTDAILTEDFPSAGLVEGTRLGGVPYLAYSVAATWHFDAPGSAARIEYTYVGDRQAFVTTPGYDEYGIVNFRFTRLFGPALLTVGIDNLLDERTILGQADGGLVSVNTPRTIILGLGFSF